MEEMPSSVFAFWKVLMDTEPCGDLRGDFQTAQLLSFLTAALGKMGGTGASDRKMSSFMLDYWDEYADKMTGEKMVEEILTIPGTKKVQV